MLCPYDLNTKRIVTFIIIFGILNVTRITDYFILTIVDHVLSLMGGVSENHPAPPAEGAGAPGPGAGSGAGRQKVSCIIW